MICDVAICTDGAVEDVISVVLVYSDQDEFEFEFDEPVHLCARHHSAQLYDLSLSVLKTVRENGYGGSRLPRALRIRYTGGREVGYQLGIGGTA